jgi:Rhs element Vgr protein
MLDPLRTFFDHSRHTLVVRGLEATLDVLAFDGEEQLSQPFKYRIEFTSSNHDIIASDMLRREADFSLHSAPHDLPPVMPWDAGKVIPPLRTLHGVVTGFKRLSGSNDEARYEITLQPRLALLERGRQFRIYQHQSVPEIVESILRSRHDFEGQDFLFSLVREYLKREQVMQYGEDDLTFISRLLAEVGIWFRFTVDQRLRIDVVEFHDDQRHYAGEILLPYRAQSGLGSSGVDGVWQLQTEHQVVEQNVNIRAYHHRDIHAFLDGDVDQTRGSETLYGEAYHYAEPYTVLGDRLDQDEDLLSESGFFYARLRHERYLNNQTQLSGVSSSPTLALAQVLKISGGAPQAFGPGAVITRLITRAARHRSFEVSFEAIPYAETICFRPPLLAKPEIAGTVPARVTSTQAQDTYSHIDREGRYKVSFLFDRDSWKPGEESLWLRLARPYAGDTHGLHLPLTVGDYTVKSAHNEYLKGKAKQVPHLPDLPVIASAPAVAPLPRTSAPVRPAANSLDDPGKPEAPVLNNDLDEEEEEEELEGITLRLGLFFDGTGNNLSNSATTAQCQREDLQLFSSAELASIVAYCGQYGFSGFDGNWFDSTPDTSYGNAASNVVHLHRLWQGVSPALWKFYSEQLPAHPQWRIEPDAKLVAQVRQILLAQLGRRNAEASQYKKILNAAAEQYPPLGLSQMSDARQSPLIALFNTLTYQGKAGLNPVADNSLIQSAKQLIGQHKVLAINEPELPADSPLDGTFGPLLALTNKDESQNTDDNRAGASCSIRSSGCLPKG